MSKTKFSIQALSKKADEGHEIEILDLTNVTVDPETKKRDYSQCEGTGMFLTLVGQESSIFKRLIRSAINKDREAEFKQAVSNKPAKWVPIEEEIENSIETLVACTTGWRDVVIDEAEGSLPFTPENVARLYAYDFVREQADRAVMQRGDFTKG